MGLYGLGCEKVRTTIREQCLDLEISAIILCIKRVKIKNLETLLFKFHQTYTFSRIESRTLELKFLELVKLLDVGLN